MSILKRFQRELRPRQRLVRLLPNAKRYEIEDARIHRFYAPKIEAAKKERRWDDARSFEQDEIEELMLESDEREQAFSRALMRRAHRLHVPTPPRRNPDGSGTAYWDESHRIGGWALTPEGIRIVREEIHDEIKRRHERLGFLLTLLAALTGVIGAITGLVAVLKSHP